MTLLSTSPAYGARFRLFTGYLILVFMLVLTSWVPVSRADEDFAEYYSQVYQIRVISPQAGSKSSIGSGFQVSQDGLIITNFHVVAQADQTHEFVGVVRVDGPKVQGVRTALRFDVVEHVA